MNAGNHLASLHSDQKRCQSGRDCTGSVEDVEAMNVGGAGGQDLYLKVNSPGEQGPSFLLCPHSSLFSRPAAGWGEKSNF